MTATTTRDDERTAAPEGPDVKQGLLFSLMAAILGFHVVIFTALVIFAAASRGGDEPSLEAIAVEAEVDVIAGEFFFTVAEQPGGSPIELTLDNQGAIFHNLEIEGVTNFVLEADAAQQDVGVVELADGTWVMYCSVPGHREAGMEAPLIVGG